MGLMRCGGTLPGSRARSDIVVGGPCRLGYATRFFRSTLGRNILALYLMQMANYLLPLITVPYVFRVLGPGGFGAVAFGESLVASLGAVVNYGFELSATRLIAKTRHDPAEVSRIAGSVWVAKCSLCLLGLLAVSAVSRGVDGSVSLILVLYGIVVGQVFFPVWLFQGLERITLASGINLGCRLVGVGAIFALIKEPSDTLKYAAVLAMTSIAGGTTGAVVARSSLGIKYVVPSLKEVWGALTAGWTLFLSRGGITLFTTVNAFLLGYLANATAVGIYAPAERVVLAASALLSPVANAVYPRSSYLASTSVAASQLHVRRLLIAMTGLGICLTAAVALGARYIAEIIMGPGYARSIPVLWLLSSFILIDAVTNVLGIQLMLALGHDRPFRNILFAAGFGNIILALLLVPRWAEIGSALAMLVSGIVVLVGQGVYVCRKGLLRRVEVSSPAGGVAGRL